MLGAPSAHGRRRVAATAVVAIVVAAALALTGCSSSGGTHRGRAPTTASVAGGRGDRATATPPLQWRDCSGGQCATLRVPLDYSRPDGTQIQLALLKVPARDESRRIGSLLVNPGGPGASGVDLARGIAGQLPSELRSRFDIVGWDPRGTGDSTSVNCGNRLDYLFAPDASPDNTAEQQAVEAASKQFADTCARGSGTLLPFISSDATAQDMDRIRAAVGDDKLTYLGYSYGTYLGTLYAHAFPGRVRALVLDGAVDPALSARELTIQQAQGFELALNDFFTDCETNRGCAFYSNGDPQRAYEALEARIDAHPLVSHHGSRSRVLGPTQYELGVTEALYGGRATWPLLATALAHARSGDPTDLLGLFDDTVHRDSSGRYSNEYPAFLAISCLDGPSLGSLDTVRQVEADARIAAPHFGVSNVTLGLPCEFWPVPPVHPTAAPVSAPGAPPIVVIGTTGDPATPVAWARGLAAELGSGRLLLHRGEGHTAFPAGDSCLDGAVVDYLVRLVPPADGTTCG
ncbi:MAG TPA: alpha/beta hydrolase [Acidimicrobiia bacterium]